MTNGILYFTKAVYDQIVAHSREGKPLEVCGILRGRGDRVFEVVRGRNVAPDPVMDYVIDPQTLLRQFDFEEEGDEMVAIYHSHPVSPAYPSASDAWNAHYPDSAYLICSLQDDDAPQVRAFRMTAHEVAVENAGLYAGLSFDETRPGRFAYFQAADSPLPKALRAAFAHLPTPFYVVFESSDASGTYTYPRVVSIQEHQIEIVS